ncbi:MAG: hypothetical protein LDL41_23855, partial [Coleofasciculus sp. S288]|nr:hypothetical protein [Coleofasciculus sp. S288]
MVKFFIKPIDDEATRIMWSQLIVNRLSRLILPLGLMLFIGLYPTPAFAQTDPAALSKAVQEIEFLDAMRSSLASTLEGRSE